MSINLFTQSARVIDFNLYEFGGKDIVVSFRLSNGPACNGYKIWHSSDSINYYIAYEYSGICGTDLNPVTNTHTITNVARNQYHFVKIEAIPYETTIPKKIYIGNPNFAALKVYPNPVVDFSTPFTIRANNITSKNMYGFIYNQVGTKRQFLNLVFINNMADINLNFLEDGMYIIWLTDESKGYSAKFIVKRNL